MDEVCGQLLQQVLEQAENFSGVSHLPTYLPTYIHLRQTLDGGFSLLLWPHLVLLLPPENAAHQALAFSKVLNLFKVGRWVGR